MVRYCAAYGCFESTKHNKNRRFYSFPSDEPRCKQWMKAIGRMDLEGRDLKKLHSGYFVCDLHFTDNDRLQKKLKGNAVPSVLLSPAEDSSCELRHTQNKKKRKLGISSMEYFQISNTSELESTFEILSEDTPQKRKLQLELKSEGTKRRLFESQIENVTTAKEIDTPPLLKKICNARNILKLHAHENIYDQKYIMFALNVCIASPVAYQVLSKTLNLPSTRTLQRRAASDLSTKFGDNQVKCLISKIANMSESEKYCIISADLMSLKKHLHYQIDKDKVVGFHEIDEKQTKQIATQAVMVMARGVISNWEQPLAFCFLDEMKNYTYLNKWLEKIIAKMFEIGFNVVAFTSDHSSIFMNMSQNKSISPEKPFFFVNGNKIYYIFDVPHLIKSLRNNLIHHDFIYQDASGSDQVASWNAIERMYDAEQSNNYKIAFKLTDSHIRPNNLEKKCLKYATQVLSRTVAVAISTLIETGNLPEISFGTTKLIELINDTFDILNSSTVNNDYKYKKAFNQADYQINTLAEMQHILSGLRVINRQNGKDVTNKMKFIEGFLISIQAILSLSSDLKNAGYNNLFTRRLNQDPLGKFFEKVRQHGGNIRKLSAIQFYAAFRKLFIVKLLRQPVKANSTEDLERLLMKVEEAESFFESKASVSFEKALKVGTVDYRFEIPEENDFTYICGYMLKKGLDHHDDCVIMKRYVHKNELIYEKSPFIYYRTEHPFGTLINPPKEFIQYIKQIDCICRDHLTNSNFYHVGNEMMTKIDETSFNPPCPCFPLYYLNKLFVRFLIFNVMHHNNKNFRNKSVEQKFFSVSHLST